MPSVLYRDNTNQNVMVIRRPMNCPYSRPAEIDAMCAMIEAI